MNNNLPGPIFYSITEASRVLGVSPTTLRRWEEEGRLMPNRTMGGDRRYSPDDIQRILKSFREETDQRHEPNHQTTSPPVNYSLPTLPPLPPKNEVVPQSPPPPPIPIRQIEDYRSYRPSPYRTLVLLVAFLIGGYFAFETLPPLTRMRLERAFSPGPINPIVDINDAIEYRTRENGEIRLGFKFPVNIGVLFTKSLNVAEDAILNTARFFGTVFLGEGTSYFLSPTGDASFRNVSSQEITVTSLNVENLTVSGSSVGGGGGGSAGGDAQNALTLGGRAGSYYLDLDNEVGTCVNCLTTAEIDESTLSIAAANADTLDFLDSTQFLRSDTSDSFTAGTLTIADGTTLAIDSSTINLGNAVTDLVIFNGQISSNIIPFDNLRDLGSAGLRWLHVFADEIDATTIVGTISGGETTSSDWRINSDNPTADLQDATITFDRGTSSPNGVLRWDSTLDRYRFETFALYLDSNLISASTVQGTQLISTVATSTAPLTVASTTKVANLNADLFDDLNSDQFLRSDTSDSFTSGTLTTAALTTLDINGNLAWGGATVTETLNMNTQIIENIGNAGTDFNTSGGLTLAGDLTVTGGEIFLNPLVSSSSTAEGTIYYDSDNDKLFVYANGAFARLATDMTKYSASNAALANQGYIEIAHNQATTDLSLTAWYYDSILGQWRTIENYTTTIKQALQNEFDDAAAGGKIRTNTVGEVGGSYVRINGNLDMGNGSDGDVIFSANTNINTINKPGRTCTDGGDAVNYSVTALAANTATLSSSPSSGCIVANDKVLLISLQGTSTAYTNVGNYEILEVQSISTNTVTFKTNKVNRYGDNANDDSNIGTATTNQRVMLQRIPQYTSVTVNTGISVTPSDWDGVKNGVLAFMANGSVALNGTGTINANGKGYRGGAGGSGGSSGYQGESIPGVGVRLSTANQGGGGGGCDHDNSGGAAGTGGGGGYGAVGTTGQIGTCTNGYPTGGTGGGIYGDAGLTDLHLGSAGGGGGFQAVVSSGYAGGDGGGAILLMVNSLTVTGGIQSNGNVGVSSGSAAGSGGGGSGGGVKILGKTLALGSSIVAATGGAGGVGSLSGGAGAVGRIAIFYTDSRTGATNPGATETQSGIFPYGLYHSVAIPTSNAIGLDLLRWEHNLPTNTKVSFQTRSGNSTDPTDGTWEDWKPEANQKTDGCSAPNCLLLESADTHTNWVGTNATVAEGDVTRNVDYFEDEDESDQTKLTKLTSSTNGGYAEATPIGSPVDISSYDYVTLWVRASQTGTVLRFGFGEAAATEQTEDITIDTANTWQKVYWDLSDVAGTARNAVTKLRLTNLTTSSNTIYVDNVRAEKYGSHNYLINPSNCTGWTLNAGTCTSTVATNPFGQSTNVQSIANTGTDNWYPYRNDVALPTGYSGSLTYSAWIKVASGTDSNIRAFFYDDGVHTTHPTAYTGTGNWVKYSWTFNNITISNQSTSNLAGLGMNLNGTVYVWGNRWELGSASTQDGVESSTINSTPNNYTQYRAILTTVDVTAIPRVENVTLEYHNGYRMNQPDNNTVRLYNYTGSTQNVRLEAIVFGADLAEWYPTADLSIEAGEVVSIAGEKDESEVPKIKKSDQGSDPKIMGIISTRAGLELGIPRDDRRLVGLAGRVPVKIAPDSATIRAGDLLTSSGTYPGMAQKATGPGFMVAKALESWDPASPAPQIDAFLNVSWADPGVVVDTEGDAAEIIDSSQEPVAGSEEETTPETEPSEPVTQKILPPKVEAEEGFFQRLAVTIEAVFEKITVKIAQIAEAFIQKLTVESLAVKGKSIGQVVIEVGETEHIVEYPDLTESSKVFFTLDRATAVGVEKTVGEGFKFILSSPVDLPVTVDYWIVE